MQAENWKGRKAVLLAAIATAGLTLQGLAPTFALATPHGQAATPVASAALVRGTVTAVAGNTLTVKDDQGVETKISVPDSVRVLQLPPGSKSLSAATPIKLQDIAVGDRVLVKTTTEAGGTTASTVIAMKQADIAQKQQHDRQDWQTRGVNGVVKSIDPTTQTVTVSTGSGPTAKTIVVQAAKGTTVRRYAPDSTKFDDAKPATLDQIKPGDQLRAKGDKNSDGTQIAAEDIVAGTFHNIAGIVVSVDTATNAVTVNDLATKKPFVVNINGDSQLHKLSPMMAQGMAMRLKGGSAGNGGGAAGGGAMGAGQQPAGASGAPPSGPPTGGAASSTPASASASAPGGASGQRGGGDLQQALNRAPVLQLTDLKKGDAVMVLTTEGQTAGTATAITLLAGVEPLLQASPSASQSVLSASWNLSGGAAAGQDAQ